jgi:hypothetical protein
MERVPWRWYHVCLTVTYREKAHRSPGPEANPALPRKIYVNGELNFEVTTEYLPDVRLVIC